MDQRPFICFNGQKGAIISACLGDWKRAAVPLCWNNKEIMGASLLSVWLLWSFCSFRSGCTKTLNRTGFSRRSPTITTLPTNTAVRWWTPSGIMLLVLNVSFLYWRSCTSKTTMTTTVAVIRKNGRILSKATCLFTQTLKVEKKIMRCTFSSFNLSKEETKSWKTCLDVLVGLQLSSELMRHWKWFDTCFVLMSQQNID